MSGPRVRTSAPPRCWRRTALPAVRPGTGSRRRSTGRRPSGTGRRRHRRSRRAAPPAVRVSQVLNGPRAGPACLPVRELAAAWPSESARRPWKAEQIRSGPSRSGRHTPIRPSTNLQVRQHAPAPRSSTRDGVSPLTRKCSRLLLPSKRHPELSTVPYTFSGQEPHVPGVDEQPRPGNALAAM